jgi:hypothetical protein
VGTDSGGLEHLRQFACRGPRARRPDPVDRLRRQAGSRVLVGHADRRSRQVRPLRPRHLGGTRMGDDPDAAPPALSQSAKASSSVRAPGFRDRTRRPVAIWPAVGGQGDRAGSHSAAGAGVFRHPYLRAG